jgi:hypothetical protein
VLRAFCERVKLRRRNLPYYWTLEYGKSAECHFHFLIAKTGLERLSPDLYANTLSDLWKGALRPFDSTRHGIGSQVNIKPYNLANEHPAVNYCLKREFDFEGKERERYDFLSQPLIKLIKANPITH